MRRQLLVTIVGVLAAALLAFAVPLALAVRGVLTSRALDGFQGEVEQLGLLLDGQARNCLQLRLFLETVEPAEGAHLVLLSRQGDLVFAPTGLASVVVGSEVDAARSGRPGTARRAGELAVAVPLATEVCGSGLILHGARPDGDVASEVRGAWLRLAAVGAGVLALGVGAGLLLSRRLAGPFERLAGAARALGDGDFTARTPRSGLDEADAIADALDVTADRLGAALARGTSFAADASHQLRTPLTALRLQLETLEATGADPEAVAAALAETDRLEATIEELAALTTPDRPAARTDLGAVVAERVAGWRAHASELGRDLRLEQTPAPPVHVRPAAITQALHVLLDNAFEHGVGTVTVRVGSAADGTVRACVTDQGPGISWDVAAPPPGRDRGVTEGSAPRTGGRGLQLARALVEAEGGRLVIEPVDAGTSACIVIPARDHPPSS